MILKTKANTHKYLNVLFLQTQVKFYFSVLIPKHHLYPDFQVLRI